MYIGEVGRIIYSIYMMKYLYIILKKWFCPVLFTWIGDNGIMLEVMGEKVIDSYIVYDYVNEMPKIMCILGYFEMSWVIWKLASVYNNFGGVKQKASLYFSTLSRGCSYWKGSSMLSASLHLK